MNNLTKGRKRTRWWLILAAIVTSVIPLYQFLPSLEASWPKEAATSQRKLSAQGTCESRFPFPVDRTQIPLPPNHEWSEEVTPPALAGKCYYFEGPRGTEVMSGDGSAWPITEGGHVKMPPFRFRGLKESAGQVLTIDIEK